MSCCLMKAKKNLNRHPGSGEQPAASCKSQAITPQHDLPLIKHMLGWRQCIFGCVDAKETAGVNLSLTSSLRKWQADTSSAWFSGRAGALKDPVVSTKKVLLSQVLRISQNKCLEKHLHRLRPLKFLLLFSFLYIVLWDQTPRGVWRSPSSSYFSTSQVDSLLLQQPDLSRQESTLFRFLW